MLILGFEGSTGQLQRSCVLQDLCLCPYEQYQSNGGACYNPSSIALVEKGGGGRSRGS